MANPGHSLKYNTKYLINIFSTLLNNSSIKKLLEFLNNYNYKFSSTVMMTNLFIYIKYSTAYLINIF